MASNKKLLPGICICLLVTAIAGSTIAFFTSFDRVNNRVGIGHNESIVDEEFPTPPPVVPDETNTFTKEVTVRNNDSVPCFIRVSVAFSDSDIGQATELLQLNSTDWIFCSKKENAKLGGYYYYKNPVLPGQSTLPLFKGIQISSDADFSHQAQESSFDVIVYEESVQQGANTSYLDAWNQFIRE